MRRLMATDPVPHADLVRTVWVESKGNPFPDAAKVAPDAKALPAWVSHGRWIVQCPDCLSAVLANVDQDLFFCVSCGNYRVDGAWRKVVWPPEEGVAAIEQALIVRPFADNRNWVPGEAVRILVQENADMPREEARRQGEGPNGEPFGWQRAWDPDSWHPDLEKPTLHPATRAFLEKEQAESEQGANDGLKIVKYALSRRTPDDTLPAPVVGPRRGILPGTVKP